MRSHKSENSKVSNMIRKIESEEEKEAPEVKKIEGRSKPSKKKENSKEESKLKYLFVDRKSAYLQGLMPETRRGLTPASSCLESGEASRATRLSSAGRSRKEAEGIGVQELLE